MRISLLTVVAFGVTTMLAQPASAQDDASAQDKSTSFRGIRVEGNIGGDRFQSQGVHNDKFGYGATIGFDGVIGGKIVVGPEGSFWRANDWTENCTPAAPGGDLCHKSFEEWGAAVRLGYLVTPQFLVYGKGGYVNNEQRKRFDAPAGQTGYYDHFRSDGYQVGGGLEYTLTEVGGKVPVYVGAQYVYSQYSDHTSRQRLMGSIGFRFK
jgi:outer membrane immunogenic protein